MYQPFLRALALVTLRTATVQARVVHLGALFRFTFSTLASFAEIGFVCGKWRKSLWCNPSTIADITIRALSRLKLVLPARWPPPNLVGFVRPNLHGFDLRDCRVRFAETVRSLRRAVLRAGG